MVLNGIELEPTKDLLKSINKDAKPAQLTTTAHTQQKLDVLKTNQILKAGQTFLL